MQKLAKRFINLFHGLGFSNPENLWYSLSDLYSKPWTRSYHTLGVHIRDCLDVLDTIPDLSSWSSLLESSHLSGKDLVEIALWGHDAIYWTESEYNEFDSAVYWVNLLSKSRKIKAEGLNMIFRLIMETRHNQDNSDGLFSYIRDIDLHCFSQSYDDFKSNSELIRQEYMQYSYRSFWEGRKKFLQSMMPPNRPSVFRSEYFKEKYEEIAIANIRRSVEEIDKNLKLC